MLQVFIMAASALVILLYSQSRFAAYRIRQKRTLKQQSELVLAPVPTRK